MRYAPISRPACAAALCLAAWLACAQDASGPEMPPALRDVSGRIQTVLDSIDLSMNAAAKTLSGVPLDSDAARDALRTLLSAHPYAVDACTVSPWGRIVAAEPNTYQNVEGTSIRRQEQMRRLFQTHKPVMSLVIDTVEGFRAIDIEFPLFDQNELFTGSVSLLVRHEKILGDIIQPTVQGLPINIWVMQTDGTVLYSHNESRIGTNMLTGAPYESRGPLLGVAQQVARESSGAATYQMDTPEGEPTRRSVFWTTVALYGTEWRVGMVRVIEGNPEAAKTEYEDLQLMLARDALQRLCDRSLVKRYMQGDNTVGMRRVLEAFYQDHPYLYSVQWLDAEGETRFGYPEDHSLHDFDHNALRNPQDQEFLDALKAGEEHWMVTTLREGDQGVIYLCPVKSGNNTLGMIYFISLLNSGDTAKDAAQPATAP